MTCDSWPARQRAPAGKCEKCNNAHLHKSVARFLVSPTRDQRILADCRIDPILDRIGTFLALSGDVYDDGLGRSIWLQMSPGGAIYHFGEKIDHPTARAVQAMYDGQEKAPVFKLLCLDGTGGSREVCIQNPLDPGRGLMARYETIGAVNEEVNVAHRIVQDSVSQGSYNYAETIVKGLPAHQRLDVNTDPMRDGYYVEPPGLFRFSELFMRRFPENDREGNSLADQSGPAP